MQERVLAHKFFGAIEGMPIAQRGGLIDKMEPAGVIPGDGSVSSFIAGPDNDTDLPQPGPKRLFKNDAEYRFFGSVSVNQGLQGQGALLLSGCGDNGFGDLHDVSLREYLNFCNYSP